MKKQTSELDTILKGALILFYINSNDCTIVEACKRFKVSRSQCYKLLKPFLYRGLHITTYDYARIDRNSFRFENDYSLYKSFYLIVIIGRRFDFMNFFSVLLFGVDHVFYDEK